MKMKLLFEKASKRVEEYLIWSLLKAKVKEITRRNKLRSGVAIIIMASTPGSGPNSCFLEKVKDVLFQVKMRL